MPLEEGLRSRLREYMAAHVGDEAWHLKQFDFISDTALAKRLSEEFISARYIYKLLESVEADHWLLRAQIKIQVLMYASIYEAVLHHMLFTVLADETEVRHLTEYNQLKKISIPTESLVALKRHLRHNGVDIIPSYQGVGRTDETKVRFDAKASCAAKLGMIDDDLRDELIEIYEARNAIHIHAEIRKSLDYQLDLSKLAYWRMEPFREQIRSFIEQRASRDTPGGR